MIRVPIRSRRKQLLAHFYETTLRDCIDFTYAPLATKLEKTGRDIPQDSVILRITARSLPANRRNTTSVILSREEFISEFLPAVRKFKNQLKKEERGYPMSVLFSASGKKATITFNADNTVSLKIAPADEDHKNITVFSGINYEKANEILKENHFVDEIAEIKGTESA